MTIFCTGILDMYLLHPKTFFVGWWKWSMFQVGVKRRHKYEVTL